MAWGCSLQKCFPILILKASVSFILLMSQILSLPIICLVRFLFEAYLVQLIRVCGQVPMSQDLAPDLLVQPVHDLEPKSTKSNEKIPREREIRIYHHASARPIQKFISLPYSICSLASNFLHYQPGSLSVDFRWSSTFCRWCKLWSGYQVARMHSHQCLLSLYLLSADHWIQKENYSSIDPR